MVRCFIAVKFGEEIEGNLEEFRTKVKQLDIDASFAREFHCTLAFLGELYEDQVEKTIEKLKNLKLKPTEVQVEGAGFFPNENFIRVFWVGVEGLEELQTQIAKALNYKEKFSGHLTIARIKSPRNLSQLREFGKAFEKQEFGKTTVDKVFLMKSTLSPLNP